MSELLLEKLAREVSDEEMKKIKKKYLGLGAGIGALIGGGAGAIGGAEFGKRALNPKISEKTDEAYRILNEKKKKARSFSDSHSDFADRAQRRKDKILEQHSRRAYELGRLGENVDKLSTAFGAGAGAWLGAGAGTAIGGALARRKINKLFEE